MVEKLFRLKWGRLDGLGALIISPTRELAMQIFDELRKVGARHDLSAGLLIGGKNVKEERERINGERSPLDVLQDGTHRIPSYRSRCFDQTPYRLAWRSAMSQRCYSQGARQSL